MLLPVFLLNRQKLNLLVSTIRLHLFRYVMALGAMAIMPLLLLVLYYFSTGTFVLYSYKDESFDFLHPHFLPFLFGQDSGILLYTPALFISMVLALLCKPGSRLLLFTILIVLLVSIYVHSSWWCWWYGHTFGSRTMLDFMVLFAILVAYSLTRFSGGKKVATIVVYSLSACITMIVYHQAHHGYLGGFPKTDYFLALAAFFGL